jgi:hypothetical protein
MFDTYFFHIPELDLNNKQRSALYKRYLIFKATNKNLNRNTYQGSFFKTFHTDLDILEGIYSDKILDQIKELCKGCPVDKFERGSSYEFLMTKGKVKLHRDPVRLAVITIPLRDEEHNNLEFWNEETTRIVKKLDYDNKTYIMRTRPPHSVLTSAKPRVFWQGSIYTREFDNLMKEYKQGKLFKSGIIT